jgi:DNA invertase Pin-like site-specific DNA recombinase
VEFQVGEGRSVRRRRSIGTARRLKTSAGHGKGLAGVRAEQYFDSCGIFRDAVISIAATLAKQERLKISERTIAGLQRAKRQGRVGGRPRVAVDRDKVRKLRAGGKSLGEIAAALSLSKSTVARLTA